MNEYPIAVAKEEGVEALPDLRRWNNFLLWPRLHHYHLKLPPANNEEVIGLRGEIQEIISGLVREESEKGGARHLSLLIPNSHQVYSDVAFEIMKELGLNDQQNPADLQDWRHPSFQERNFINIKSLIRDYLKNKFFKIPT